MMVQMIHKSFHTYKKNLILLPFAGGTGEYYHNWLTDISENINAQYCLLPGRGRFLLVDAYDVLDDLINDFAKQIMLAKPQNLSFFGHSMGALIAFETARVLYSKYDFKVEHLFLSGHRAPCLPYDREFIHKLSKESLFDKLHEMGGVPQGLTLEDLEPFLPTLYRDFELCENYQYKVDNPLPIPFSIFYAKNDPFIQEEKIEFWQNQSTLPIKLYSFAGEHFYINDAYLEVIDIINLEFNNIGRSYEINC